MKKTNDVDALIKVLKQVALKNQKDTEKKLRTFIPTLNFSTFMILVKIISEEAIKLQSIPK